MVALTRIRNNQVYNSDIYADAKVVAKSISGGLLSDNFTYTGNMTIGNLTINGNTTTVDTTNLVIADPMFSLNRNQSGAPSYDLGMVMGRGSATNVAFIWEEAAQQFQLMYTTQSTSATTFGQINNSGYANLQVYGGKFNNTTITTSTVTNDVVANTKISGGTIDDTVIGFTTPNTGGFTTIVTTSNIYAGGNIIAASGTNSTSITTGSFVTQGSGGVGIGGTLSVGGGILVSGNGNIVSDQTTANIFNSAPTTTTNLGGGGIVKINGTANSYGSGQGALQIGGGFYADGDSYIRGNLVVNYLNSIGYNAVIANAPLLYLAANAFTNYNYEIGFYSHKYDALAGYNHTGLVRNHLDNSWFLFSNIRTEPDSTVDLGNVNIIYDTLKLGNMIAYSGNASTTTDTGAVVVVGGVGISGKLNVGSNIYTRSTTTSTSTTTGAIVADGGAGIAGNIYSGANIYVADSFSGPNIYVGNIATQVGTGNLNVYAPLNSNVTVNASQLVANVIIHGNAAAGWTNLLVTNGANGSVGIKTAPSAMIANASLMITSTDSVILPVGTTAQRPPNGTAGMFRFNNQSNNFEFYNPSTNDWTGTGSVFTIISDDQFTGDGSTVAFTLSQSGTTNSTLVFINGVAQLPLTAYSVSGTTLTFTEAPLSTDIIDARVTTTTSIATALSAGTSAFEVTDSGGSTGNIHGYVNGTEYRWVANAGVGGSNYFGNGISTLSGNVSCSTNVPTVIDSFSTNAFRGAKYVISMQDYTNSNFQMAEVIMVCGTSTATIQTYGVVAANGTSFCNFYANISGTTARLYANSSVSSVAKVQQIYMPK